MMSCRWAIRVPAFRGQGNKAKSRKTRENTIFHLKSVYTDLVFVVCKVIKNLTHANSEGNLYIVCAHHEKVSSIKCYRKSGSVRVNFFV